MKFIMDHHEHMYHEYMKNQERTKRSQPIHGIKISGNLLQEPCIYIQVIKIVRYAGRQLGTNDILQYYSYALACNSCKNVNTLLFRITMNI